MSKFEVLQTNKVDKEIIKLCDYADKQIYYNKKYDPYLTYLFQVPFFLLMSLIL